MSSDLHAGGMNDSSRPAHADVLVIGGGAGGLAAALVLARSRRDVVLIDAGEPRNAPADAVHNYLGREGTPPAELTAIGREEVQRYGARVVDGRVVEAVAAGDGPAPRFDVRLDDGSALSARRIVLATGVRDELPDVPGLAERWGRDVLHCPYCHGWEVQDRRIGVLATNAAALHQVGLFRQLSDHVCLLVQDVELGHRDRARLRAMNVPVVEGAVTAVHTEDDALVGVTVGGERLALDAVVVASFPDASHPVAEALGVPTHDMSRGDLVMARALTADAMTGATTVPGVVVVGNAANPMGTTIAASANGTQVGAMVNAELVEEDTALAVQAWRTEQNEPGPWDERYADHVWSSNVNPRLPERVSSLAPGRALDVGCGEGADVLWLAGRGWDATGMDFSAVGLERAALHAAEAGVEDRTHWRQEDVRSWEPDGTWDLVVSHYLHLADDAMADAVGRLAGAVAPGGTLLVVLHHPDDVLGTPGPDGFPAPELVEAVRSTDGDWEVETDVVDRVGTGHGPDVVVRDIVLVAHRLVSG